MTYFLRSWEREISEYSGDELITRLIVAMGMLGEYRERLVNNGSLPDLEDYITNIAGRANSVYVYFTSITGKTLSKWVPWRNNAKINIEDVSMLGESGLVYIRSKYQNRVNCSYDDIERIVMGKPGVDREKIDSCMDLIRKELGITTDVS